MFLTLNNVFVRLRTAFFLRTKVYVFDSFEPLGGLDPPMAQTKVLAGATTEQHCSIVANVSTYSAKMHPALFARSVVKYEEMLSQSRKMTDRAENGTSSFSRQGLSFELSGNRIRPAVQTKLKRKLPFKKKTPFLIS